jgi:hypothetical protein
MQILCAYSSIQFSCEHVPGFLSSREASHPIFQIPQKRLLSYLGKWGNNGLTPTDSYLLFLSLLKSSELVDFRVPAVLTERTHSIVAQNMESLAKTVIKLNTVTNPAVIFPRYVITPETKTLDNVSFWISNWEDSYKEFQSGYRSAHDSGKLIQRENALSRLIKNPHRSVSSYAGQIADWAAVAGSFPTFSLTNPLTGTVMECATYWKFLIHKCAHEEQIFSIRRRDLEELLEHCEENIPIGTIHSNALFKILRHALEKQKNFLGLGDMDISSSTYQILDNPDDVESANLSAMIQSAPMEVPRPEQYPTKLAYLRAKLRYDLARKQSGPNGGV